MFSIIAKVTKKNLSNRYILLVRLLNDIDSLKFFKKSYLRTSQIINIAIYNSKYL